MGRPSAALFCMDSTGHFNRLRPIVAGLSERNVTPQVFTSRRFAAEVERCGGRFVDLFDGFSVDDADSESLPFPCRGVSFAGFRADEIQRRVGALGASLVVYDAFAVIGRVVAHGLGLPHVNVCAGHNLSAANHLEIVKSYPEVRISERCTEAVTRLRDRHGLLNASPFSYLTASSPFLNLYCEPPEFLSTDERKAFDPIAFFGSLPASPPSTRRGTDPSSLFGDGSAARRKIYVSFGTVVWKFFGARALETLRTLSEVFARQRDTRVVISLGGRSTPDRVPELRQPNVSVEDYVDQWEILGEADLFITHHGLNSTHEAIFQRVPMFSFPFFGDQPGLARRCQELGLAIPLVETPRNALEPVQVRTALARFEREEASLRSRLDAAREWETRAIEGRKAVFDRLVELVERGREAPRPVE